MPPRRISPRGSPTAFYTETQCSPDLFCGPTCRDHCLLMQITAFSRISVEASRLGDPNLALYVRYEPARVSEPVFMIWVRSSPDCPPATESELSGFAIAHA